jgi:carboxy-cis,cis-muconate cyclase
MWIIRLTLLVAQWLALTSSVKGFVHNMLISSYQTPEIYALSFDDDTNNIQLDRVIYGHGGHPWLALNHDRTILYGAEENGWSSYRITSPTDIQFTNFVPTNSRCKNSATTRGDTVIAVSKFPPYPVYGAGRSPCGAVISTRPDGRLDRIIQDISFESGSRIQGMVIDPQGQYLFGADSSENGLWVHQINQATGKLDRSESIDFPIREAGPRRVVMHPSGQFLYVLLQKMSQVAVFEFVPGSGNLKPIIRFTNLTISLLPSSMC